MKKFFYGSIASKLMFISLCLLIVGNRYMRNKAVQSIDQCEAIDALYVNLDKIDTIDGNGWTALMKAALQGDIAQARALIDSGADLDVRSTNIDPRTNAPAGNTALHFALYMMGKASNNLRVGVDPYQVIAQMLIDAGANLYVSNNMGEMPIHFAIQIMNLDVQGIQYDKRAAMVAELVKYGADINAQNNNGETYTHLSVRNFERNWMVILKDYFGSVVDFGVKNKAGQTAHDLAINLGFTDLRDNLTLPSKIVGLKDSTERDIMGMNGLMLGTIRQDVPFIDLMISRGTDVNAKTADEENNSALHIAFLHQRVDMVKALLDRNANPNQPNAHNDYPIHYLLKITTWASANAIALRNQAAQLLLNNTNKYGPANINVVNSDGNTVLHLAVLANAKELVQLLVTQYGTRIDPFIRNGKYNLGQTPLQLAKILDQSGHGRAEIIRYLEMLELSTQFVFSVLPK